MHTVSDQGGIKGRLPESEQTNDVGPENHQRGEVVAADAAPPVMVQKSPSVALSGLIDTQLTDTQPTDIEAAGAVKATSSNGSIPGTMVQPALENSLSVSEPTVVVRSITGSDASSNTSPPADTGPSTLNTNDIDLLRLQANQGDPAAQAMLAAKYFNGNGIALDLEQAVYWYKKAAEQGHAGAQSQLGDCYFRGEGVNKDKKLAFHWFKKAAEQGHADAQSCVAGMYKCGMGVTQDLNRAAYWYTKAAEQGDQCSQTSLGVLYEEGKGVEQNFELAMYWLLRGSLRLVPHRKNVFFQTMVWTVF